MKKIPAIMVTLGLAFGFTAVSGTAAQASEYECTVKGSSVCLWADENYSNRFHWFGTSPYYDLGVLPGKPGKSFHDEASSLMCAGYSSVTVYENAGYGGRSMYFKMGSKIPKLSAYKNNLTWVWENWNDAIDSIV